MKNLDLNAMGVQEMNEVEMIANKAGYLFMIEGCLVDAWYNSNGWCINVVYYTT